MNTKAMWEASIRNVKLEDRAQHCAVYADWLEDREETRPEEIYAVRLLGAFWAWVVKYKLTPHHKETSYRWYKDAFFNHQRRRTKEQRARLHDDIWHHLPKDDYEDSPYNTVIMPYHTKVEAYRALFIAYVAGRLTRNLFEEV